MNFYGLNLDTQQEAFVKALLNKDKTIVFCNAVAGTGKTTLAMGAANLLVKDKRHNHNGIIYIVSPYGEGRQGYLPGDLTEKSEVYFEPAYQAMVEVGLNPNTDTYYDPIAGKKGSDHFGKKPSDGFVKMITHTYLRGNNTKNKVVIIDEAQNFTVSELKKVLTRCHDTCKVVVIGHTGQIDIAGKSGFARYIEHFRGQERAEICKLTTNYRGWLSQFADKLPEVRL